MLELLGLSAVTESVYRAVLANPELRVADLAAHLQVSEEMARASLDELADLALLRSSWDQPGVLRPVSPQVGLASLLSKAESQLAERQRQIDSTKAAVAAIALEHQAWRVQEGIICHSGLDGARSRLEELAHVAQVECVSFTPGAVQRPDTHQAAKPANQVALERGVTIRSIYQDSFRNDPDTLAYVRWLTDQGGQTRSVAVIPMMMVIIDKKIALLPTDPSDSSKGALETQAAGLVAAVYHLFEQVWSVATPFGAPEPIGAHGLSPQELQLVKLLSEGCTDEMAGRQLNLSVRTVSRMMATIMERLGARSRFQAGVEAMNRGWLN